MQDKVWMTERDALAGARARTALAQRYHPLTGTVYGWDRGRTRLLAWGSLRATSDRVWRRNLR